ncbi:MAG: hypothetical protein M5U11_00585 [Anaerolineales bacterium]|nr:hypothetical protein [Anaerolineales bacterium]
MNIKNIFGFFKKAKNKITSGGILREFIYLDDVSVHSLLASTRGPVAFEYLDTLSNTSHSEVEGGINLTTGLASAETKARRFDTLSHGTQVTRKSIIQALFKQLYDQEKESLIISPIQGALQLAGEQMSLQDMQRDITKLEAAGWVIDPSRLQRGQLIEVEIQLEADMVFRISTVISVFREIIEENIGLFGHSDSLDITAMKSIDKVLEKILVGLIPIRGLAVDYRIITINNKEWIVHQKCLARLSENVPSMPLYIVGVTEQRLYWKDIRRLLFAKSRYSVFCRLSLSDLRNTWSPIKIVNLLDSVVPGLTQEMHLSQPEELAKMMRPIKSMSMPDVDDTDQIDQLQMKKILQIYADLIAKEFQIELSQLDRENIEMLSERNCSFCSSVDVRRIAFNSILSYLSEHHTFKPDPNITSEMRNNAIIKAKIDQLTKNQLDQNVSSTLYEDERFLDTEFIAIYW